MGQRKGVRGAENGTLREAWHFEYASRVSVNWDRRTI